MEEILLVSVLVVSVVVALVGFTVGERRRKGESGRRGPRPCRSIGEALRQGKSKHGRVLVLFLGSDEPSLAAGEALAADPPVLSFLSRPDVFYAVIPAGGEDRQVADTLFSKYAKEPMPEGPTLLLLDPKGLPVEVARIAERGALGTWLADWVLSQPLEGRQISSPEDEARESAQEAAPEGGSPPG